MAPKWTVGRKSCLACYQRYAKNHNLNIKNAVTPISAWRCLTSNAMVLAVSVKNFSEICSLSDTEVWEDMSRSILGVYLGVYELSCLLIIILTYTQVLTNFKMSKGYVLVLSGELFSASSCQHWYWRGWHWIKFGRCTVQSCLGLHSFCRLHLAQNPLLTMSASTM